MRSLLLTGLISAVLAAGAAKAATPEDPPPQNNETACNADAAGAGPGLHVEVRDQFGLYRAGETVMVSDISGMPLATINCSGPWANFRLAPGEYRVSSFIGDEHSEDVAVNVPMQGASVTLTLHAPEGSPAPDEVL